MYPPQERGSAACSGLRQSSVTRFMCPRFSRDSRLRAREREAGMQRILSLPVTSLRISCGTRLKALPMAAGAMKAGPMRVASGTQ